MSRKVALLIGVSEYGEGIPSLSAPLNDVAAMEQVLKNPNMGGFDEVKTSINLNQNEIEGLSDRHLRRIENEGQKLTIDVRN